MVYTEEPNPVILDREAEAEVHPLDGTGRGARGRSCAALWRVAAAEACGTALLVALTCLPCSVPRPLAERALASGLCVAALVQCFDHVSGAHFNPTVTLAALLARRVGGAHAVAALAAQVVGALTGAAVLWAITPAALVLCVTCPATSTVSVYQALCVETLLGAVLALVNLAAWDARNAGYKDSWPLRIGFTVVAMTFAAGDVTGASMNPVRSAAPALLTGDLRTLWLYCVGPPCGACVAAALYACAWRDSSAPQPTPHMTQAPQCPPPHKQHTPA